MFSECNTEKNSEENEKKLPINSFCIPNDAMRFNVIEFVINFSLVCSCGLLGLIKFLSLSNRAVSLSNRGKECSFICVKPNKK